jgi:hypothetical protein
MEKKKKKELKTISNPIKKSIGVVPKLCAALLCKKLNRFREEIFHGVCQLLSSLLLGMFL